MSTTSGARSSEGDNLYVRLTVLDGKPRNTRLELESLGAGGTGIYHYAISRRRDELTMCVAVHDHTLRVRCQKLLWSWTPELVTVTHMDVDAAARHRQLLLEIRVICKISVPVDCLNRRDEAELVEYRGTAYVARMQNEADAPESLMHRWTKQPMRIRDQADDDAIRLSCHAFYITRVM